MINGYGVIFLRIEGMVFDMDGTLLDTERQYIDGYIELAKEWGLELPKELPYECMGLPREKVRQKYAEYYGEDFEFEKFKGEMMERLHKLWERDGIPVKTGVQELLDYCREREIPCAVATSTARESAVPMLKKAGLLEYFTSVVCGDEIKNGKPNPDIFLEGARRIGVPPEKCGGAEDSRSGICAVHSASMTAFFMIDVLEPDKEIEKTADYICSDMFKVMDIIEDLNS